MSCKEQIERNGNAGEAQDKRRRENQGQNGQEGLDDRAGFCDGLKVHWFLLIGMFVFVRLLRHMMTCIATIRAKTPGESPGDKKRVYGALVS